jgi:hypothetical protein
MATFCSEAFLRLIDYSNCCLSLVQNKIEFLFLLSMAVLECLGVCSQFYTVLIFFPSYFEVFAPHLLTVEGPLISMYC